MKRHPLEDLLNATADEIMSAVMAGFRAIVDVKGKLAEYFLNEKFEELKTAGHIADFTWNDNDRMPDFEVVLDRRRIIVECKNVRSPKKENERPRLELQKTRNSKDGKPTRAYKKEGVFDVIAVALFNHTKKWEYAYALASDLPGRADDPSLLEIYHYVPLNPSGVWSGDLLATLEKAKAQKQPTTLL